MEGFWCQFLARVDGNFGGFGGNQHLPEKRKSYCSVETGPLVDDHLTTVNSGLHQKTPTGGFIGFVYTLEWYSMIY